MGTMVQYLQDDISEYGDIGITRANKVRIEVDGMHMKDVTSKTILQYKRASGNKSFYLIGP